MLCTFLAGVGLGVDEVEVTDHDAHPFEREQLEHAGEATLPDVPKRSAGLLVYRRVDGVLEVLVGHMGGPLWAHKDAGAWSIPKGEYDADEPALDAARREFEEELGLPPPDGALLDLGESVQTLRQGRDRLGGRG